MSTNYIMSLFVVRENGEATLPIKNIWNHKLKSFQEFLEWTEENYETCVNDDIEKKFKELSKFNESRYINTYLKKDVEHLSLKPLTDDMNDTRRLIEDPSLLDVIEPSTDLDQFLDPAAKDSFVQIYKKVTIVFRGRYYSSQTLNRAFKDLKQKLETIQRDLESILRIKDSINYWTLSNEERANMDEEISSLISLRDEYFNHLLIVNSLESMCAIFSDEGFDGQPYIHISSDWDVEDYKG